MYKPLFKSSPAGICTNVTSVRHFEILLQRQVADQRCEKRQLAASGSLRTVATASAVLYEATSSGITHMLMWAGDQILCET